MGKRDVAIVGMSGRFPNGETAPQFWQSLVEGYDGLEQLVTVEDYDPANDSSHWVELTRPDDHDEFFDASFFGLSPKEADSVEPQQRLFLEVAWEALEDGGYAPSISGARVGVFAGAGFTSYYGLQQDSTMPVALVGMIGADKDYLATRVAHHLELQGPAFTVQSACSTSLVAIHLAAQALLAGECDAALAGGVNLTMPRMSRYYYLPGGMLSPDGRCRTFDANAGGTVFTEGVGVVLLMRLEDALAGRHPIYAVIKGSAVNNDGGAKASYMAPSVDGQERVIRQAMDRAGVSPADIGYVEAHGTATIVGDAIELASLTRVFRAATSAVGFCQIGSVKPNIGHTACAAGVAGLMKAALALHHDLVPPNISYETPNPDLRLDTSPFYVGTAPRPWPRGAKPRLAAVNSFGVGGTNAHAVLQEAPVVRTSMARRSNYILTLSARTDTALATSATRLRERLKGMSRRTFADIAYTLNLGRSPLDQRAALVCKDAAEARRLLRSHERFNAPVASPRAGERTIGFLFPGQGAQFVGMGAQLYVQEPAYRAQIDQCLNILKRDLGLDLGGVLRPAADKAPVTEEFVAQTSIAQPALFAIEYALGRLLMSWGLRPSYAMGHSIGEYAAACLAEVMSLPDALKLVTRRGALMQAMEPGAMLSVGAAPEEVRKLLGEGLTLAAINGPRQCVVSGEGQLIDALAEQLKERGLQTVRLRTSHAFHSPMMEPMLAEFRRTVDQVSIRPPAFPFVSNATGEVVLWEQLSNPDYWVDHIRRPVQFAEGLQTLQRRGVDILIEVGPGRQLTALANAAGVQRQGVRVLGAMPGERGRGDEHLALLKTLSHAWMEGAPVDWLAFYGAERRRKVALPTYPFERERFRTAPNLSFVTSPKDGKAPLDAWLYEPGWRRVNLDGAAASEEPVGPTIVFADDDDFGAGLAAELRATGCRVVTVARSAAFSQRRKDRFDVDPANLEHFVALFEKLKSLGLTPRRVVHAWSLAHGLAGSAEAAYDEAQVRGVFSLTRILHGFHAAFGRQPLAFDLITEGVQDVTGQETLRPEYGSMIAFMKVAPQEQPNVTCRLLDVEPPPVAGSDDRARRLADALAQPTDRVVALRRRYWWTQTFERVPGDRQTGPCLLRRGGVYLITGGLGQIGMVFARRLVRDWDAKLVLVGRSTLPDRTVWSDQLADPDGSPDLKSRIGAIQELESLGGEVAYVSADVSDLGSLKAARQAAYDRFGALNGVIFGAGRIDSGCGVDEVHDFTSYDDNAAGKVHGLRNALDAFGADPLDFGLVLSSISTVLGGLMLCPYSSANQIADLMVLEHNRGDGPRWLTTNWDLWAGGRFSDDERRQLSHLLALAIKPEEGADTLEAILRVRNASQLVVSTHDLDARLDMWVAGLPKAGGGKDAGPREKHRRPHLASTYAEPQGEWEPRLAEIFGEMLGIDKIGRDDDFFEMGGHSLLAVQTASAIHRILPPGMAAPNLYDAPTIRAVGALLEPVVADPADDPAVRSRES